MHNDRKKYNLKKYKFIVYVNDSNLNSKQEINKNIVDFIDLPYFISYVYVSLLYRFSLKIFIFIYLYIYLCFLAEYLYNIIYNILYII